MAQLFIPAPLRAQVGGQRVVTVHADTVGHAIDAVEAEFPGIAERLVETKDGRQVLRSGLQVAVNGAVAAKGLREPVTQDAEIHILPAIGGG